MKTEEIDIVLAWVDGSDFVCLELIIDFIFFLVL